MEQSSIYGGFRPVLEQIKETFENRITEYTAEEYKKTGIKIYEHLIARVKSEESALEKCERKGLPQTPHSAMKVLTDSIGIRIICSFIDDIYANIEKIRAFPDCRVIEEKDYIRHAKPNGYRSYHMILEYTAPFADADGNDPGTFFIEIQLRTIAMDSWAALEHKLKYKKNIANQEMIVAELKRCADELASCDLSMTTIRDLIEHAE
ncbi:MAG: GTP pyrophosphokinase family protein [Oscillospiraceae bacterium]|nr:GTP pyrophosphokinase family protein [Oscillospiraceae bacterium]